MDPASSGERAVDPEPAAADIAPTFEDLAIDDRLGDLERIQKYAHSNIALQRYAHSSCSGLVRRRGARRLPSAHCHRLPIYRTSNSHRAPRTLSLPSIPIGLCTSRCWQRLPRQ